MRQILFSDLISEIERLDYNTGIYADVAAWLENPLAEPLHLADQDEEAVPDFDERLEERGMQEFFQLPTLQDIVRVERKTRPNGTIDDLIAAVRHYRSFDAFRP